MEWTDSYVIVWRNAKGEIIHSINAVGKLLNWIDSERISSYYYSHNEFERYLYHPNGILKRIYNAAGEVREYDIYGNETTYVY